MKNKESNSQLITPPKSYNNNNNINIKNNTKIITVFTLELNKKKKEKILTWCFDPDQGPSEKAAARGENHGNISLESSYIDRNQTQPKKH